MHTRQKNSPPVTVIPVQVSQNYWGQWWFHGLSLADDRWYHWPCVELATCNQLPRKIDRTRIAPITVLYQIEGRLCQTFRPYGGEVVLEKKRNALTVQSTILNPKPLIDRLIRYQPYVTVLGPNQFLTMLAEQEKSLEW